MTFDGQFSSSIDCSSFDSSSSFPRALYELDICIIGEKADDATNWICIREFYIDVAMQGIVFQFIFERYIESARCLYKHNLLSKTKSFHCPAFEIDIAELCCADNIVFAIPFIQFPRIALCIRVFLSSMYTFTLS